MNITAPYIRMTARLKPAQGDTFQPTGFPEMGAGTYTAFREGNEVPALRVESHQSMANRLEAVCWDEDKDDIHETLRGMPYINVLSEDGHTPLCNSLTESHRLNSAYIINGTDHSVRDELAGLAGDKKTVHARDLAGYAFRHDPNAIIHGVWLSTIEFRYRMTRALTGFIDAIDVREAHLGGSRHDKIDSTGDYGIGKNAKTTSSDNDERKGSKEMFGNAIYPLVEYTARDITAYFGLDMALIRSYRLGDTANDFLYTLALWKVRRFLEGTLRLRSRCEFITEGDLQIVHPEGQFQEHTIPLLDELDKDLKRLTATCVDDGLFDGITTVKFEPNLNKKGKKGK